MYWRLRECLQLWHRQDDLKMKDIFIYLNGDECFHFNGRYLPKRQTQNWHYYEDDKGTIYHIRKEHMIAVIEKEIKKED